MHTAIRSALVFLLTAEARLALLLHRPKIIAVTGNVGKTTTKDAIVAATSAHMRVRGSEKSFNSEIGVPLTILGLGNPWSNPLKWMWALLYGLIAALMPGYPELLVLEVGADHPGDIASIAAWLRPHIAVYTGVPEIPVHVAFFNSRGALVVEKRSLLEHIRPGGTAIVNGDFDVEEAVRGVVARVTTYGFAPTCDVSGSDPRIVTGADGTPLGMSVQAAHESSRVEVRVEGVLGKPILAAALAAIAVADALGIDMESAAAGLGTQKPTPGRMRVLPGVGGSTIIDDSYNSSPAAALSALETLRQVSAKRRIAVLGDMRELGEKSAEAHREVGASAADTADLLITVGEESKALAQAAREAGLKEVREYGYDSSAQVGKELAGQIGAGDVVLVKGSQNRIRLERAVYELLADRSRAEELLVRFDPTWRKKA